MLNLRLIAVLARAVCRQVVVLVPEGDFFTKLCKKTLG